MGPIRRLDFFTIYSKDLDASRRFYVDSLGFDLMKSTDNFFQIEIAGTPICVDLDPHELFTTNIGLEVDSIESASRWLKEKNLRLVEGVNVAASEEWVSIADPDGNNLVFLVHATGAT